MKKDLVILKQKPAPPVELTAASLADWIEAALEDIERVERSKAYTVDMDLYVRLPSRSLMTPELKQCLVCFAGATMVGRCMDKVLAAQKTLGGSLIDPDDVFGNDSDATLMMEALDEVRCGDVQDALETLDLEVTPEEEDALRQLQVKHVSYEGDKGAFKRWCREVVRLLRQIEGGLLRQIDGGEL